jgi:cytochrome c biogenesis protein CcmG/thiol:disulfide interchange protein DsbE
LPSTRSSTRTRLAILIVASVAIAAGVLALVLVGHDSGSGTAGGATPSTVVPPYDASKARVGHPAPTFALRSIDGGTVDLARFRGRPVVLTFFASWCHPCEEELPVLEKVQKQYGDKLAVVGVNFRDSAGDSRQFVHDLKITFPALVEDEVDNPVAARYGVNGPPMTFFIDAQGNVAAPPLYGSGSRKDLQPGLDALLPA